MPFNSSVAVWIMALHVGYSFTLLAQDPTCSCFIQRHFRAWQNTNAPGSF